MLTLISGLLWQLNWILFVVQGVGMVLIELATNKLIRLKEMSTSEDMLLDLSLRESKRKRRNEEIKNWDNEFYSLLGYPPLPSKDILSVNELRDLYGHW